MSKAVGKVFGSGSTGTYGYETNYTNYLRGYNTADYDQTLKNMVSNAADMSKNLQYMPEYQFGAQTSDEARRQAQEATYQSYVDMLTPQYQQQMDDMQTRLVNQGIPVGSQAYNRAANNLQSGINDALNQAAYQSVVAGQDAYSQALSDNIKSVQFNNDARQSYINQIKSLLDGSVSGYDNALNLYNLQNGIQSRRNASEQSGWNNMLNLVKTGGKLFG